jgi:hypothetical protein
MVPTSPVRSQPSSLNLSSGRWGSPSAPPWYAPAIHGPRTSSSPAASPSHGRISPPGPARRASTPQVRRPWVIRYGHRSSGVSPAAGGWQ